MPIRAFKLIRPAGASTPTTEDFEAFILSSKILGEGQEVLEITVEDAPVS